MSVPCENRGLLLQLRAAVSQTVSGQRLVSASCQIEEFGGCTYLVSAKKDEPHVLFISFVTASPLPPGSITALRAELEGSAEILAEPEESYQLVLKVGVIVRRCRSLLSVDTPSCCTSRVRLSGQCSHD